MIEKQIINKLLTNQQSLLIASQFHPDIFEDSIVGRSYDAVPPISHRILMWDPVCKIRRVSESEIAYAAKIYNETVVWMDERNGNADIYMARIPEACCGDPDHPYPVGDLNKDCLVDLLDLAIFALHWLEDNRPNRVVTTIYQFQPDPNALTTSGGIHGGGCGTFSVEGCFQLNVDSNAGTASFKQVNATISDEIHFFDYDGEHITDSLGALFNMTKLFSTNINDTEIEFVFEKNVPSFPLADVSMKVTFLDDTDHTVRLVGSFCEPVYDGFCYHLDAVAVAASDEN